MRLIGSNEWWRLACKQTAGLEEFLEPIQSAISEAFGTVAETRMKRQSARIFMRERQASSVLPLDSPKV
jgi:hypothetical protein